MPNWTANSLKLIAKNAQSEAKLAQLVQELARAHAADEVPQIFNMIKPIPQPLQIVAGWVGDKVEQAKLEAAQQLNLKLYGYQNWYDFCVAEWGTKWELRLDETMPFELEGHVLTMWFDTAWSPPIGIYQALEAMGFEVEATYIECGVGFVGYYRAGTDTTEDFDQFSVIEEAEDYQQFDDYFTARGFTHSPSNLGG
jgi:hypothetical protein